MGGVDWIDLSPDRAKYRDTVTAVMKFLVPRNVGNFLNNSGTISFSKTVLHGFR